MLKNLDSKESKHLHFIKTKIMKNFILALLCMAICLPSMTAQPDGYDENFEEIGAQHNKAVKDVLKRLSHNPTLDELIQVLSEFTSKVDRKTKFYEAYKKHPEVKSFTLGFLKAKDQFGFVSKHLSRQESAHLKNILSTIDLRQPGQVANNMNGVIEGIINDESLDTNMKNALLYSASTGVNSTALWLGEDGPVVWTNSKSAPPTANLSALSIAAAEGIIKSDATGALAGAIVGGIAGGLGAPVTGTGGAIMGGGAGSVKTALGKAWDWIVGD